MKNEKTHAVLRALVGGYLLYLAWELFKKYREGTGEMPDAVFLLSIGGFTVAGIGILIYSYIVYRKNADKDSSDKP